MTIKTADTLERILFPAVDSSLKRRILRSCQPRGSLEFLDEKNPRYIMKVFHSCVFARFRCRSLLFHSRVDRVSIASDILLVLHHVGVAIDNACCAVSREKIEQGAARHRPSGSAVGLSVNRFEANVLRAEVACGVALRGFFVPLYFPRSGAVRVLLCRFSALASELGQGSSEQN